jgi:hypothetical protein
MGLQLYSTAKNVRVFFSQAILITEDKGYFSLNFLFQTNLTKNKETRVKYPNLHHL